MGIFDKLYRELYTITKNTCIWKSIQNNIDSFTPKLIQLADWSYRHSVDECCGIELKLVWQK